jgi:Zn-dependent protease with chaperone function
VPGLPAAADDYLRLRKEMMATGMAAVRGDAAAMARMQAFAQAMGGEAGLDAHKIPNLNDLALAQKGDRAAIARLRVLRQQHHQDVGTRKGRTGLQTYSFVSFHPPLNKRAKRLQKMGARLVVPTRRWGPVMTAVMIVVYTIGTAAFAFLGAMMLFVIAMMIGLNLLFLTLWLSLIHWAFAQDWAANAQGFIKFVSDVVTAFRRMR